MDTTKIHGLLAATWAILGMSVLLISAIVRLSDIAWDMFSYSLNWIHWSLLIINILFMIYSEGYKGFQLKFSPRFAARCLYLTQNPRFLHTLLAPFFCMGYFYTTRTRKIVTFVVTVVIIVFIQLAHMLAQPWRGILDAGVVVGLSWGIVSLYYYLLQAFAGQHFNYSAELPGNN